MPSVPILSHAAQAMNPQVLVGRDLNRGLDMACLILTSGAGRASSDLNENGRFLTWEVRGGDRDQEVGGQESGVNMLLFWVLACLVSDEVRSDMLATFDTLPRREAFMRQ